MILSERVRLDCERIEKIQLLLVLGILFFIPISPAAPNLLGVLLVVVWFWEGRFKEKWFYLSNHPIFWAMLAYLVIYPLSLLWSENLGWGLHMVERHMIYTLFPFLLTSLRVKYMKAYLLAFILGVTFTEVTSYALWFELFHIAGVLPNNPSPFYVHTEYNPILAWALYLLMFNVFFEKQSLPVKLIVVFFVVTMTVNMFITGGRGGQVTYFVITMLVVWQFFSVKKMHIKGVLAGLGFIVLISISAYQFSTLFQNRVDVAVEEVSQFSEAECAGSVGQRLCMYLNTSRLSLENPLWGSGVGDFPEDYNRFVGPDAKFKMVAAKEIGHSHPHNQYLYELGALGVVGLSILLWIFWTQIRIALRWQDNYRPHRIAFVFYMSVVLISDSLLLSHPTGLIFICFSALLFFSPIKEKDGLKT